MISRPLCYVDVLPAILEHSLLLTKYLYHYCQVRIPIPLDSCLIYLSSIAFPPITSISPLFAHLHIRQLPHPSRQLIIWWFLLQLKPKNTGVGSLSLLQWIFMTQEVNQDLLHCRQIFYQLSYQGSPRSSSGLLNFHKGMSMYVLCPVVLPYLTVS